MQGKVLDLYIVLVPKESEYEFNPYSVGGCVTPSIQNIITYSLGIFCPCSSIQYHQRSYYNQATAQLSNLIHYSVNVLPPPPTR